MVTFILLVQPTIGQRVRIENNRTATSCSRRGSGWILGKISSLDKCLSIGAGSPGRWWCPHAWEHSRNKEMEQFVKRFHGGIQSKAGLDDLGDLFQLMILQCLLVTIL